jgi:hypothetical protein
MEGTKMLTIKEMACHTWALSGNPIAGELINKAYTAEMNKIGAHYEYGHNLRGKTLEDIQQETMEQVSLLCEGRTQLTGNEVYLCGGFRGGQVCPEHLWLEDHTTQKTYDTFIDQDVRKVDRVGEPGGPFQPGCEGTPFLGNQIARVRVNGYTLGQYNSLPK